MTNPSERPWSGSRLRPPQRTGARGWVAKGIARIVFPDGELVVPARSPYEWQAVFEHVDGAVKRFGRVRLELNCREWLVTLTDGTRAGRCGRCRELLTGSIFAREARELCLRCVKHDAGRQRANEIWRTSG